VPDRPPLTADGFMSDSLGWGVSYVDTGEHVADLVFPQSTQTFNRMRTDPQLTAVLAAYTLPLRAARWSVDPSGCRPDVARLVADDLGLPLLGEDASPGAARRRGVQWAEHLRMALLMLTFGFCPFAQRYEMVDGRARLAELSVRLPSTVEEILTERDGSLAGIRQTAAPSTQPTIPDEHLVWYAHEREGAAWQGRSLLRPAFGAWLLKHETWRVHATSIRRFGMGVPNVEAPAGATPQQVTEAQRLASAARVGNEGGVGLPGGFKLNLTGLTGSVPDALAFIRYLDQQMAQMVLASVLNLDASPNGSRALGETFVDLLYLSLDAIADEVTTAATGLAVQMVGYNWGDDEPAPRVVCSRTGAQPEATAQSVAQLIQVGALAPDAGLESWLRRRYDLPPREDTSAPVPVPPPPGRTAAVRRPARAVDAASDGLRRRPTDVEARAATDFGAVQVDWLSDVDTLEAEYQAVLDEQRAELEAAVAATVEQGSSEGLASLAVASAAGAAVLRARMRSVARRAAARMADEAALQGVDVGPVDVDTTRLDELAATVAALSGDSLARSAARKALQLWGPGASGRDVAAGVREYLEGLTGAALRDNLGAAVSAAANTGRLAVVTAAPPQLMAASEILDQNACGPCIAVDGTVFATPEDAQAAYPTGGYADCQGWLRCRGMLVAVWDAP
jgi:hypothetical protein